jgi:hypothetical protein
MRVVLRTLCAASLLSAVGVVAAAAQTFTYPFKELEDSRRERIASDRRMKREAVEQRRKEKEGALANVRQNAPATKARRPERP